MNQTEKDWVFNNFLYIAQTQTIDLNCNMGGSDWLNNIMQLQTNVYQDAYLQCA